MILYKINIKPLSVNRSYRGRKFRTLEHIAYEKELLYKLPPMISIPKGKLYISIEFGMSKNSDIDNPCKIFVDVLQKKFSFNDRNVYSYKLLGTALTFRHLE